VLGAPPLAPVVAVGGLDVLDAGWSFPAQTKAKTSTAATTTMIPAKIHPLRLTLSLS
jgi:hypothetical protein